MRLLHKQWKISVHSAVSLILFLAFVRFITQKDNSLQTNLPVNRRMNQIAENVFAKVRILLCN
jgi:hypothetical protein